MTVYCEVSPESRRRTFRNNNGTVNRACPEPRTRAIDAPNLDLPDEVTGFRTVAPGAFRSLLSGVSKSM